MPTPRGRLLPALAAALVCASGLLPARPGRAEGDAAPDLLLFKRAMTGLWARPGLLAETDLTVTADGQGGTVTSRENLHLFVSPGGRYQARVTMIRPDGGAGVVYQVAGDGRTTTTYRPGLGVYAVRPADAVEAAGDEFPILGLYAGALYLSDPSVRRLFDAITPQSQGRTRDALAGLGMTLSSRTEALAGTDYTVYALSMGRNSYFYRFFVDPKKAEVGQIEMMAESRGVRMRVTERVAAVKSRPPGPGDFRLVPPAGARRVPALPVSPFTDEAR